MTRNQRYSFVGIATIVLLVLLFPLSVALPLVAPRDSGLSARRATGTMWSGTLHDARVAGMALGDTQVGLSPLALLVGEARLSFVAPALRGTIVATANGYGIVHGSGPIDIAARVKPLPLMQLVLDDASVRFRDNRCSAADGRVRAVVGGDIGGLALPGGMSGSPRCDGAVLLVPLVGQSGMERIDLRVTGEGKWRAELSVRPSDPAMAAKLNAAGLVAGPGGFAIRLHGAL